MNRAENTHHANLVLFLGSDIVGRGEDRYLGGLLMQKFLHTLIGHPLRPKMIALMNEGVRLVTEDSLVLGEMRVLEEREVEILACGTCLSRLGLTNKLAVGKVSNMNDITDIILKADKVVCL